jgi:hypothetical protein
MSYSIGGNNFSTYDMMVSSCRGAMDMPGRLGEADHDWEDLNGVEPYVESGELKWNGREIRLNIFYDGADLISEVESFITTYKGASTSLITSYGTFTVYLKSIETLQVFIPNEKAIIEMVFWQPTVSVPSTPAAIGGTGVRLGSYDFLQDFGLYVKSARGLSDIPSFTPKARNYYDTTEILSAYRKNRRVNLLLNGNFTNLAAMLTKINNLHAVLRTAGVKILYYKGLEKSVYFADKVSVVNPRLNIATLMLILRISE